QEPLPPGEGAKMCRRSVGNGWGRGCAHPVIVPSATVRGLHLGLALLGLPKKDLRSGDTRVTSLLQQGSFVHIQCVGADKAVPDLAIPVTGSGHEIACSYPPPPAIFSCSYRHAPGKNERANAKPVCFTKLSE